jgi:hypothetical protein
MSFKISNFYEDPRNYQDCLTLVTGKAFSNQIAPDHLFFESFMSVTLKRYPTIRYLRYYNDQNQLVLGCITSADQICTHFKSYTHKGFKKRGDRGQFDLKKTLVV